MGKEYKEYLYVYHYDKNSKIKNQIWQKWTAGVLKGRVDSIDISKIKPSIVEQYKVILIDFFVMAWYNKIPDLGKYLAMLKPCPKKILYLLDLHEYTFNRDVKKNSVLNIPSDKPGLGYIALKRILNKYNIKYIISRYNNVQFRMITRFCPIKRAFTIGHHINADIFKDYKLNKKIDVLIYGSMSHHTYPLRHRIKNLLIENKDRYSIKYIPIQKPIYGRRLAKLINMSWLCLATESNFDYLVIKYFEITACNSVILGSLPPVGKKIWGKNCVEISKTDSDSTILKKIDVALADKKKLLKKAAKAHDITHRKFTYDDLGNRVFSIMNSLK